MLEFATQRRKVKVGRSNELIDNAANATTLDYRLVYSRRA
jgi:hypothetical protein